MPPSAPRYDERILAAARRFDDERQSIAETCRLVGRECDRFGLTRPSYVHLRRFIRAERTIEAIQHELVEQVFAGLAPRIVAAQARAREATARADLQRRS